MMYLIFEIIMRNKADRVLRFPAPFPMVIPRDKALLCSSLVLRGQALLLCGKQALAQCDQ